MHENGSIIPLEKLVEVCSKISRINFYKPSTGSTITSKTFAELLKIPHFLSLGICELSYLSQDFDIESFYIYMKKNKHTRFTLRFSRSIPDAYKNRLEEIVDELLDDGNRNYKSPMINFDGLAREKYNKMLENMYN